MSAPGDPGRGWVAPEVASELPGLAVWTAEVAVGSERRTARDLKARLRGLSDRWAGAQAVELRRQPVPHAYRVFFRHVGLDPDEQRTPVEAAVLDRLFHGGFRSHGRLADALLVALVETGVAIAALDAALVTGRVGVGGERGRLVLADEAGPIAPLFAELPETRAAGPRTERSLLVAVQVPGVPAIHVEEALWTVLDAVSEPGAQPA